ncbi:uncharacterized protein TNCV_3357011 [Trichonephila clavipes]|nr:uncharacterized protein TNCV_3357011 [Trichonephila clavipes]
MELEGIRVSQNMETNKGNSVLHLVETNKIFSLPPLAVPSKGAILPPVLKSFSSSWADRVESSTPSSGMDKTTFSIEEQQIVPDSARYFIMRTTETFPKVSQFLIEKAISGSIGAVKTIRKMRSGDFFIEVSSSQQASALTKLRHLAFIDVTVVAHRSLNYSRGVISAADLLHVSTEEILENLQDQKVWSEAYYDKSVKAAYLNCPVRPYIPNPLRCFQCQRFGHSKLTCRGQATCARCAEVGHDSADCKAREKCVNCKRDHASYSRSCPNWSLEKEITVLKIKNKISYPEAQRIVSSRTPVTGVSYAAVAKTSQISASTQYNLDDLKNQTPLSPVKSSHKKLVITDKTVSKTSTQKPSHKKRIERLNDSKVLQNKKRYNLSKKTHQTSEVDMLDLHGSEDESLMGDLSPTLPISSSKQGASAKNS